MYVHRRSNWNLECWFLWREENRRTRRRILGARPRTNNKLNPHMAPGRNRTRAPYWWETSALTTAPPLLPKGLYVKYFLYKDIQVFILNTYSVFRFVSLKVPLGIADKLLLAIILKGKKSTISAKSRINKKSNIMSIS